MIQVEDRLTPDLVVERLRNVWRIVHRTCMMEHAEANGKIVYQSKAKFLSVINY